jgi:hypothetical protein
MARLPIRTQQVGFSPVAQPRATAEAFGAAQGRALQELGRAGVQMVGAAKREEQAKRTKEKNTQRIMEDTIAWKAKEQEIFSGQDPDGDPEGYAKSIMRTFEDFKNERLEGVPEEERDDYLNRLTAIQQDATKNAYNKQAILAGNYTKRSYDNAVGALQNNIMRSTSSHDDLLEMADVGLTAINDRINSARSLNEEQRAALKDQANNMVYGAVLNSLMQKGKNGAEDVLSLIDTGAFDDLNPKSVQSIKSRATRS